MYRPGSRVARNKGSITDILFLEITIFSWNILFYENNSKINLLSFVTQWTSRNLVFSIFITRFERDEYHE